MTTSDKSNKSKSDKIKEYRRIILNLLSKTGETVDSNYKVNTREKIEIVDGSVGLKQEKPIHSDSLSSGTEKSFDGEVDKLVSPVDGDKRDDESLDGDEKMNIKNEGDSSLPPRDEIAKIENKEKKKNDLESFLAMEVGHEKVDNLDKKEDVKKQEDDKNLVNSEKLKLKKDVASAGLSDSFVIEKNKNKNKERGLLIYYIKKLFKKETKETRETKKDIVFENKNIILKHVDYIEPKKIKDKNELSTESLRPELLTEVELKRPNKLNDGIGKKSKKGFMIVSLSVLRQSISIAFLLFYNFFIFAVFVYLFIFVFILQLGDIFNCATSCKYFNFPALMADGGIVNTGKYEEIRKSYLTFFEDDNFVDKEVKLYFAKYIAMEKLKKKYGVNDNSDLEVAIMNDQALNSVSWSRIKKIKQLILETGEFDEVSKKYGDEYGEIFFERNNLEKYFFINKIIDLSIGEDSEVIINNGKFYIFRLHEISNENYYYKYVLVDSKKLDNFINESIDGFKFLSFIN